ncbi:MAG: hypothetical protein EXS09_06660 [Gemmataceae bacterium]|nr:hypothetical protein [Gemmataceae bacterium]
MFSRSRILSALTALALVPASLAADDAIAGMKKGTPDLKAAGALAFGPDGVLFIADAPNATIHAVATGDTKSAGVKSISIPKIDELVGGLAGTTGSDIIINDLKVNPVSGNVYLSTASGKGPGAKAMIVKIGADGKASEVSLKDVMHASVRLANAGKTAAITSMAYHKGDLYVAGLTTEAWASNLKMIPFPFSEASTKGTGVEIYHGAHGAYETKSPVQTFMAYEIAGQTHLLASYVCTPLVKFPVAELKKSDKVRGTTIAELGNRNRPLDIIAFKKDGKDYALISNSARGVMKVSLDGVEKIESITARVNGTAGLKYDSIKELDGTSQLDKLNETMAVVIRKTDKGTSLETVTLP